jgi:hypothetical protein
MARTTSLNSPNGATPLRQSCQRRASQVPVVDLNPNQTSPFSPFRSARIPKFGVESDRSVMVPVGHQNANDAPQFGVVEAGSLVIQK